MLTQGRPAALDAAAAMLAALALNKTPPDRMYEQFVQLADSPEFAACLARLPELLEAEPAVVLSAEGLREGGVARVQQTFDPFPCYSLHSPKARFPIILCLSCQH